MLAKLLTNLSFVLKKRQGNEHKCIYMIIKTIWLFCVFLAGKSTAFQRESCRFSV